MMVQRAFVLNYNTRSFEMLNRVKRSVGLSPPSVSVKFNVHQTQTELIGETGSHCPLSRAGPICRFGSSCLGLGSSNILGGTE